MVGGDKDQGLVGVGVVEVHRSLNGVAHLQHIVDGGSGIVGVAGPVNLTGLGHHKEALLVVQQLDALLDVVGQLPLAVGSVHGVVHGLAVTQILGNDQGLACTGGQSRCTGLGSDHVVTGVGSHGMVVGAGTVAVHLLELAAGKVLKAGVCQFHPDLVVVLAGLLVGIESSGGGVVDVHGGDDANLIALLGVQLFSDGLVGHIAGPRAHIDDTALGLVAGGDGGGGGSGVRAEGGAVIGGHAAHLREAGKAQVSLGHSAIVVHGALVEACGLDLGSAHAVANEQENVLGLFEHVQQTVLFVCCGRSIRLGGVSGYGGSRQHAHCRCNGTGLQEAAAGNFRVLHNRYPLFFSPAWGGSTISCGNTCIVAHRPQRRNQPRVTLR